MRYIISKISTFDEDEGLWMTKIGGDRKEMQLHYIALGKTRHASRMRAAFVANLLNSMWKNKLLHFPNNT